MPANERRVRLRATGPHGRRDRLVRDGAAAVLESARMAQLLLVPLRIESPLELERSTAGEILTTIWRDKEQRDKENVTLWFCKVGGDPTQSNWVELA